MKKLALISLFVFLGVSKYAKAQTKQTDTTRIVPVVTFAEQMPEFDGDMYQYIAKNIRYPAKAKETGIQGRVIAQFVVTGEGEITQIEILKTPDELLSNEVIRLIGTMPVWRPGKQNGKPISVRYTLPVLFKL
ncbi:MAG: energy transducer TonB [Bacteroidota bacterium]